MRVSIYTCLIFSVVLCTCFHTVSAISLLRSLSWRSALKTFVPVAPNSVDISPILEAARMAPSSFGVQPYHIHVVTDPELKERLRVVSFDQPQITQCSHLLIFTARNDAGPTVERFVASQNLDVKVPPLATSIRSVLSQLDNSTFLAWSTNQAFIALGFSLCAAAELRIGSCPMSGFVPEEVHKLLALPKNEHPVAYMAIGSKSDKLSPFKKMRLELNQIVRYHRRDNETSTGSEL